MRHGSALPAVTQDEEIPERQIPQSLFRLSKSLRCHIYNFLIWEPRTITVWPNSDNSNDLAALSFSNNYLREEIRDFIAERPDVVGPGFSRDWWQTPNWAYFIPETTTFRFDFRDSLNTKCSNLALRIRFNFWQSQTDCRRPDTNPKIWGLTTKATKAFLAVYEFPLASDFSQTVQKVEIDVRGVRDSRICALVYGMLLGHRFEYCPTYAGGLERVSSLNFICDPGFNEGDDSKSRIALNWVRTLVKPRGAQILAKGVRSYITTLLPAPTLTWTEIEPKSKTGSQFMRRCTGRVSKVWYEERKGVKSWTELLKPK